MNLLRSKYILVIAGLLVGMGLAWLALPYVLPHKYTGTVIESSDMAPEFVLESSKGGQIRLSDMRGKLVIVYFGYTFCPDVCPNTLGQIKLALKNMGRQADQVEVMMISVDPLRDTPDRLGRYLRNFDAAWIGAGGSEQQVAEVAAMYGVFYEKQNGTPNTGYLVDHTATVMVIDTEGHLRLVFPYGTSNKDMAADLQALLR